MILGISISEEFVYVKSNAKESVDIIPLTICRLNDNKTFIIGKDAFEQSLNNKGIIVDKLLYMIEKDNDVTISETFYPAQELINQYFRVLLSHYDDVEYITISLYNDNVKIIHSIITALSKIYSKEIYKIVNYGDAFSRYVLSLDEKYIDNSVGLIEFTKRTLAYYEMNVDKYETRDFVYVDKVSHEPISTELLSKKTGVVICNNWLNEFASKVTKDKTYSAFFLSGEGFEYQEQYRDFINYVCSLGCPVLKEEHIFASGALLLSEDKLNDFKFDRYCFIMDSRSNVSVKLNALIDQVPTDITLIDYGDEWFYKENKFDIIVLDTNELVFYIDYLDGTRDKWIINISEELKIREDRTTRLSVKINFSQKDLLNIFIVDKGFGEFYKATNNKINRDFRLR